MRAAVANTSTDVPGSLKARSRRSSTCRPRPLSSALDPAQHETPGHASLLRRSARHSRVAGNGSAHAQAAERAAPSGPAGAWRHARARGRGARRTALRVAERRAGAEHAQQLVQQALRRRRGAARGLQAHALQQQRQARQHRLALAVPVLAPSERARGAVQQCFLLSAGCLAGGPHALQAS